MPGFFDNNTRLSAPCTTNCSTCKSSTVCTSCTNATFLMNNQCLASCPLRYYPNIALSICQNCPFDCYSCDGYGSCTSCNVTLDNRVLDTNTRRCLPIDGYFQKITTSASRLLFTADSDTSVVRISNQCPTGCKSCNSATICTACSDNYLFGFIGTTALCSTDCPLRYYSNRQYKICQPCPYDCFTCDKYSNCLSCDQKNDHRKLFDVTGRCLPLPGYYDNGTSATLKCPMTCSMCKDSSICSACIQGYYLSVRSTCESICQKGSVTLITGNRIATCTKCPYDCSYCNVQGQCTSCSDSSNREMNNDTLRCVPKIGYYDNGF